MFVFLKSDHVMEFLIGQVENLNGVKLLENFLPIFSTKKGFVQDVSREQHVFRI